MKTTDVDKTSTTPETMSDNAVTLKLPSFWTQQPSVWFAQTEAQFAIRKIVQEETKYYHVVAALDQETATRVMDMLSTIPESTPYSKLKQRLLDTFDLSDYERASAILHMAPLGDQKPSQLMDRMLGLLGDKGADILFRQIFLEHLPEQVRSVLVHSKVTDNKQLAKAADSLYEANQQSASSAINKVSFRKNAGKSQNGEKSDGRATPRLCYYHKKFGTKATRCVIPCTWDSGNATAGPQ